MSKKIVLAVLCLAFASLACLQTSNAALDALPVATIGQTLTNVPAPGGAINNTVTATAAAVEQCAVVVASDALHLREAPSLDGEVLTWLNNGDVVQVLDDSIHDWWRVRFGSVEGFARSTFLINSECEGE